MSCTFGAYVTQIRPDEIVKRFGSDVETARKFCSVFGDGAAQISRGWADKGGYEAFNLQLKEVATHFGHVESHSDV